MKARKGILLLLAVFGLPFAGAAQTTPSGAAIDAEVAKIMTHTHAKGMAVAVIDHGKVGYVQAYGIRNAKGDPLTTDTVMYGASLTKTVFAYTVMQLVDQGKLNLDTPIRARSRQAAAELRPRSGFPGQVRAVQGPRRRSALGEDHAAHVPDPLHRLQQLLVHRTGPEAAHPFRTRYALQLFGRRLHPVAIRHRTRPQGARPGAGCRRSDARPTSTVWA